MLCPPPSFELSIFIVLHLTLAAGFTYWLARSLTMSRTAATVAGLAFGCGGFVMAQIPNLNIMTGAVWLPLLLYAIRQTLYLRRWSVAILAGLPLALQILTAQPQIVFYSLVIAVGYGLYHLFTTHKETVSNRVGLVRLTTKQLMLLLLLVATGLFLAAPQLLPTLELQQLSVRSQERDLDFLTENSLQPVMLLNLILPSLFGNNVTGFKGGDPFQEVFIYIGFIPLMLAFLSWPQRHRRDMPFFYLLLAGTLLLALGRFTPLYQFVIQYLPGFSLFRIPSRWLMGVNLALAILAGYGWETVRQKQLPRPLLMGFIVLPLLLLSGVFVTWLFQVDLLAWGKEIDSRLVQAYVTKGLQLDPVYQNERLAGTLLGLRLPFLLWASNFIIAATLLALWTTGRLKYSLFRILLLAAIALDLAIAGGTTINPTRPTSWWQQLSGGAELVVSQVGLARVFPLGMGSEEATVSHLGQYFPSVYRVYSAGGHGSSLRNARYDTFLNEADPVQAIQLLGVRYLLTLGQMGADVAATYPQVYSGEDGFVYENPNPLPRTFVVHQTVPVETADDALALLQVRAVDLAQSVILEPGPDLSAPPPSRPASGSSATIIEENPQLLAVSTTMADDGYLVLLDTYYPGWVATIDGQTTPIYQANYISRAVFVPAGEHVVHFLYQPWSFQVGIIMALLMLVVLAGAVFVFLRSKHVDV